MQAVNNVLKWSFYTSGLVSLFAVTLIFASWFTIQTLVMVIDYTA